MKSDEVQKIRSKYSKNIHVWCDEAHAHSSDCLTPKPNTGADERDVVICKLCEVILSERNEILRLIERITGHLQSRK